MNQNKINTKVSELFAFRSIPEMLSWAQLSEDSLFLKKLYELQKSIYYLDEVLESNWYLKENSLKEKWDDIYLKLENLGYNLNEAKSLCRNIEVYQRHELNMRQNKWPTFYTFKYLYYYKSCDVKLIRKLIYQIQPSLTKKVTENTWRQFDLVTEVNDDVEDLFEDIDTINGNRFLISILKFGKKQTHSEYRAFLSWIEERAKKARKQAKQNEFSHHVFEETHKAILTTKELLDAQIENVDLAILENSLLMPHLQMSKVG